MDSNGCDANHAQSDSVDPWNLNRYDGDAGHGPFGFCGPLEFESRPSFLSSDLGILD